MMFPKYFRYLAILITSRQGHCYPLMVEAAETRDFGEIQSRIAPFCPLRLMDLDGFESSEDWTAFLSMDVWISFLKIVLMIKNMFLLPNFLANFRLFAVSHLHFMPFIQN